MERTSSSSSDLAPPKEIKCIEELSLSQLSDVLSPSRPVESVAEETLKSSSKKSSPSAQEPVVAAKKSARIANSSSRYKKFNLLVSGIGLSKKLTPSNPAPTSNHNSNTRASTNTATSVKTAGKIKLGFNLILNKNRNKTDISIVGKQDEENDDENIEEDDETANDEESNDEVVSNSSKLLSTSSISFTSEQTNKKNNNRSSIDLSISHNSFLNKSSDSIATTERKSQIMMETETIEDMDNEIENSFNDINNNMNASQQQQRTGPRVKHVSRYPVTYLNQVDNLMSLDTGSVSAPIKKHFYHELKSINQDFSSQQINWRSFTSDLEANFTLSALPTRLKERLIEKSTTFRRSMSNGADLRRRTHSHSETDVNASAEANSTAPPPATFKKNLFHSASRTSLLNRKASSSHSAVDLTNTGKEHHHHIKQFDWDEFFEKNHKISSNQNFRFSSLLESSASSTSANAGGLVIASTGYRKAQASSDPNENKPAQNAVKRLANKLNSYKDARFHPYAFIDAANSEMSAHQQHHSGATSSSSNTGISGTIDDILADFGFDSSHYVKMDFNKENYVWDNTFANNIDELYEDGYAVLCTKQFSLKSICYLCASGPESDAQLIYCSVCCQGFHEFCLKKGSKENNNKDEDSSDYEVENERPDKNSPLLDWVCPNCKYCEICFLPDNLLTCDLCKDHYHADCLKKSHYPNKHSKFNNKWLCRKCFECKICKNRNIFYEKKLFNKMHHFDFSTCLKCHEKYKLEKPLGCCNKMITLENSSVLDRTLFQCDKCFDWSHFSCLPLPAHDIEILKNNTQLLNSIECHLCDASLKTINEKLSQIKEIIFKEIFCHIEQTSGESLTSFWEQRNNDSETSSKDLFVTLAEFLVYLSSCDPIKFSQSDVADIRVKLDEAINKKYPYLSGYVNKIEEKPATSISEAENTTTSEESAIKVEKVETNEAEVPKTNDSEQDQVDKIRLEENVQRDEDNKQEEPLIYERLVSNLIRPPYDDHLYSFTNSSISEARFNEPSKDYDQLSSEEEKSTYLKKLINEALRKDRSLADLEPDEPFRNEQSADNRECIVCRLIGDHAICGRLLPLDLYWIHTNCLLLVDGVSVDSNLVQNLQSIYAKQKTVCGRCQKEGALLTCQNQYCQSNFHLNCAYESNCYFGAKPSHSEASTTSSSKKQSHKTAALATPSYVFMCSEHKPRQTSAEWELAMNEQRLRMLLVEPKELRDELTRRKVPTVKYFAKTSSAATPRAQVGSLFVESFGDLETTSDFKSYLCPIGYSCVRLFWSTKEIGRKCLYKCRIYAAGDFKSREGIDLITRGYLEKLNANRLVVIDEDLNIKISAGDYEDAPIKTPNVHINKSEESIITPLNDEENKTCVPETDAVKMAQLDGTNDEDALAQNKKPPVINLNNLPPNKGIIRMSAPSINLNGNSAATTGVKFFQKMHNDQSSSSSPSSVKKIANQILLNNQSAVVGSDKPKVLKMDPQRIINIKNSFMNVDRPQINPCNIIRSQPTTAPRTKLIQQQQQYQTAHSTGIYHPACASSSSSSQPCSYLNINTQHSAMAALSAVAAAASASPSGNSNNDMYLNLVSPKSDKSDSSLNLNHSSFMNPLISHLPPMHDSSGGSAYDSSSASSMSNNAAAMFSFANQRQTLNLNRPIFLNAQQQQQMDQVKDVKEKKLSSKKEKQLEKKGAKKRSEGEPRSNKCTVAALLSQISRPAEPAAPSPPPQTTSISLLGSALPTASFQAPSTPSALSSSPTNTPTENSSSTKKTSASKKPKNPNKSAKKNGNKLRDYFGSSVTSAADSTPLLADSNNSKTDRISPPFFDDGSTIMTNEPSDVLAAGKMGKTKKMKRKDNNFVEVSVATKKFKAGAVAVATEYDADYSAQSQLVFEIISEDGLRVISYDINQAWKAIMDRLRAIRLRHKLKPHFNKAVNGVKMYGLTSRAVAFLLEQHNSIEFCPTYRCKYVNREWMQAATSNEANTKWVVNLNNSARTMRRDETERRKFPDRFYWLTSEHRHLNLNLSQRFDQAFMQASKALTSLDLSTSMKYRHLKEFSKNALIVKRSNIHHRGLFTLVDLQQSQMIIEYAGEIIRNELCEKREKYYESKGIGCYMFRIDEFEVIDATTKGNQARFINHSCDPNCVSRVLLIQGHKHIVIFAQRAISRGEELTYDYKFPKEDDKIKCLCKSAKCRKYLN